MELIEQITSKLGISSEQAEGATGAVLNFAKNNLSAENFSSIAEKIPGASQWMDNAPSEEEEESGEGGGLLGSLGSMAQSMGGSLGGVGKLGGLVSIFSKLGLGPEMIGKITGTISEYLGNSQLGGMLSGVLGGQSDEES